MGRALLQLYRATGDREWLAHASATGDFVATTFRARAVVAGRAAPAACTPLASLGVPCVNPTASGFPATSGAVRLR